MPDERPSFWATAPGILTGVAALITALVGAAALVIGLRSDTGMSAGSAPPAEQSGDGRDGRMSTVKMRLDDGLDVDTGMVGDVSGTEVLGNNRSGWLLYAERSAIIDKRTDEAGCIAALASRSDDYLRDEMWGDAVICLETDKGAIAQLIPSPPDASDQISVEITVWD